MRSTTIEKLQTGDGGDGGFGGTQGGKGGDGGPVLFRSNGNQTTFIGSIGGTYNQFVVAGGLGGTEENPGLSGPNQNVPSVFTHAAYHFTAGPSSSTPSSQQPPQVVISSIPSQPQPGVQDIPRLLLDLANSNVLTRTRAVEQLARISLDSRGSDYLVRIHTIEASAIEYLVTCLSEENELRGHALTTLSLLLYSKPISRLALRTSAVRDCVEILTSNVSLDLKILSARALAHITRDDAAKQRAFDDRALGPLIQALSQDSEGLRRTAVRALKNIVTAVEGGRKAAAQNPHTMLGLVVMLKDFDQDPSTLCDVIESLSAISFKNKSMIQDLKRTRACYLLTQFTTYETPDPLRKYAMTLRDSILYD